ncbi:hypothetical protein DCC85_14900 [Paenibacillus sp. CAA11]|uniref:coiled-coil domain-containing protein n=1 Tax=Paenibacillus sp. CAA11 TaxID=1532905 RepID=UPI000D3A7F65|nr:hypothetical protein [Paenibacillus sp. CAA11]AWB45381.1 hypothetical protein DCC85_14900 [Paenibacillus sp. CAA11]
MARRNLKWYASLALLAAALFSPGALLAEPNPDSTQQILEKSLSIVEIDREIKHIEEQQQATKQSIEDLSKQLDVKEKNISTSRDRAGDRIRAYYMGEREDLLGALLSAHNLTDFFSIADYIGMIFGRDQEIISDYQNEYAVLKRDQDKLQRLNDELNEIKSNLLEQRARVLALQRSVDGSIQGSSDPDKLKALISEMTAYWENVGLYEVRRHFKALASAMEDFPEFLQEHNQSMVVKGGSYTLTIQQESLNEFLRSKDELFQHFSFTFDKDKIIAEGERDSLKLRVEGHYSVEDEPKNSIQFHVDHLIFNGLELPDTTCRELENDFDLGFYPQQIIPLIKATAVELREGEMIVQLKLAL